MYNRNKMNMNLLCKRPLKLKFPGNDYKDDDEAVSGNVQFLTKGFDFFLLFQLFDVTFTLRPYKVI